MTLPALRSVSGNVVVVDAPILTRRSSSVVAVLLFLLGAAILAPPLALFLPLEGWISEALTARVAGDALALLLGAFFLGAGVANLRGSYSQRAERDRTTAP